jgi:predicted nucleic acid-binding protein
LIVVDTSVWVAASRTPSGPASTTLQELIEADVAVLALPVRIELMAGVSNRQRAALRRTLGALPVAVPTEETWALLESWIEPAARKGHRFGMADWLIAALADELGALVWSLDQDFEEMEQLKFVRLYG